MDDDKETWTMEGKQTDETDRQTGDGLAGAGGWQGVTPSTGTMQVPSYSYETSCIY